MSDMSASTIRVSTLLLSILLCCDAYKILVVFPVPGGSHSILGEGYVRHLLAAGHEVTYITPLPIKQPTRGLRQVDVSDNFKYLKDIFDVEKFLTKELDIQDFFLVTSVLGDLVYNTFQLEAIQEFINDPKEEFDLVVVEWLFSELHTGLSSVFNCPFVWSSSMVPHTGVLSLINEHLDPSYTVDLLARKYSLNFWDRVHHLWIINNIKFYRWWQRDEYNEQFKQLFEQATNKRGRQLPHFDDVRYNGSLMLGNSHEAVGDSIALPQNYKHIGGYHIRNTIDPLPKDLQKLMDDSKDGVIYFSMGSMLKSSRIPDRIKRKLLEMFAGLKQTVVWKMEQAIQDLPKNVYVVSWAPQQSILSHPNCVLFITHGGLLSLMEALTYGVPIIGVPFYADQYMNIERAAAKGFGKRIDFSENIPEDLKIAIKEMLENPKYHQSTKKWSGIFKNNIVPPSQALVYWIEYVVQTHGAPHLRSPALHVRWYTKLYLDLVLLLTVALVLIGVVAKSILKTIRNDDSRKQKSS